MRYSKDFRVKVMGTKERLGLSVRETVQSWSGRLEAKQPGTTAGLGRKLSRAALQDFMQKHPHAYQSEVAEHFGVARFAVWRALRQIGWSRKKNLGTPQGEYTKQGFLPTKTG